MKKESLTTKNTKSAELLPVKAEKMMDTEKARIMATWALGHHDGTRAGAKFALISAIACGIQLNKAKQLLPHGEFQKWQKKYLGSFTDRTARRYMTVLDQVRAKVKSDTVSDLLDIPPDKLTFEYCRQVFPRVQKLVEASTMKELLQDESVIKAPKASDQEAQDRAARVSAKNPETDEEKQLLFAQEFWTEVETSLEKFARFYKDGITHSEVKEKVEKKAIKQLVALLESITGGTVEVKYE